MSVPVPDTSTLKGVLHLIVDVLAGANPSVQSDDVASMHATIDASTVT